METVWLKAHQLQHGQIAQLAGVSENTMRDYLELYQAGGVEKLKELNFYRPVGALMQHILSLETHFQNHPPASIKEAQQEIEEITGIRRSETQVAEFLKKNCICGVAKSAHFRPKQTRRSKPGISKK